MVGRGASQPGCVSYLHYQDNIVAFNGIAKSWMHKCARLKLLGTWMALYANAGCNRIAEERSNDACFGFISNSFECFESLLTVPAAYISTKRSEKARRSPEPEVFFEANCTFP